MAFSMWLSVAALCLVAVVTVHGFNEPSYFDMAESESQEYSQTAMGEDNRLPCPYTVHGNRPPLGECGDCGFVIVEKRHHYCIPGKSVIKVMRRKPTCNCKNPTLPGHPVPSGCYGSESKVVPSYEAPSAGQGPSPLSMGSSDQVSRMLRTLINDQQRGSASSYVETEKPATTHYRTLDASSSGRSFN